VYPAKGNSRSTKGVYRTDTPEPTYRYPGVQISIPAPYSGSFGALELINGTLDGLFVSRELKPTDISTFAAAFGYDPLSIPIGGGSYRLFGFLDGLSFIVNKANPIESLTFDQLDSIFSTTRWRGGPAITKWKQLGVRGELEERKIKLYGIQPWNGFEEFVRERVLNVGTLRGECMFRVLLSFYSIFILLI
jgi:phosphate transport system substrate-binding protein